MALLLMAICFEGLGRKFLPFVPTIAFYFAKDVVLAAGALLYGIRRPITRVSRELMKGFVPFIGLAVLWTMFEALNPEGSLLMALIGLRAYWFWWLAPLIIASALEDVRDYKGVIVSLAFVSLVVAAFAVLQFARPADDPLNTYALYNGEQVMDDVAIVGSTGRVRVSSTFGYISGFTDFIILMPPLLLSVGLKQEEWVRALALVAAALSAAVMPASGSRSPVIMGGIALFAVAASSGMLSTRLGRRIIVGGAVAVVVALFAMPDAVEGVRLRFTEDTGETLLRLTEPLQFLPPVALSVFDYPMFGIGTGMQHNARASLGIRPSPWDVESEPGRILVEQGPIGYLLVWLSRFGLTVALVRAGMRLRAAGERGFAGLAFAYAAFILVAPLMLDHVYQALCFVGIGLILRTVAQVSPAAVPLPKRARVRRPGEVRAAPGA